MIKTRIEFKQTDSAAYKSLIKQLPKMKKAYVSIGFHSDAGSYDDGTDVVEVALWNEFGTDTVPQRSFIRSTLDENASKINAWREEAVRNMVELQWPLEKALDMLGTRVKILIQNKIKSNVPPPNAVTTQRQKLREGVPNVTLIDTGLMLRSVQYKVVAG